MQIAPNSSGEGVILNPLPLASKPKQGPERKNHFFTYYYKDSSEFNGIVDELKRHGYKAKIQSEICPTTKRGHLQGMVWCKNKCRDTKFKTLKGAHFERLKDEDDTANYCNKEETHDGVFRISWGFMEPKYVEEIEELYDWELEIIDILNGVPDKRTIYWFYEPDGCRGKTTFQKYLFTHMDKCVVLSGKADDMKNGIVQYMDLNNGALPKIVLINIPKVNGGHVSYCGLEQVKDMFFFSGKYKGGMVCGACPHLLIFSNEEPDYEKMSNDRWVVKHI